MSNFIKADFVFTGIDEKPLQNALIEIDNDIISGIQTDYTDVLPSNTIEYKGGVMPGMINCHTHIELSHFSYTPHENFISFLSLFRSKEKDKNKRLDLISKAIKQIEDTGTIACCDIVNSSEAMQLKKDSSLFFYNFIEIFGSDTTKANYVINKAIDLLDQHNLLFGRQANSIVPHTPFTLSKELFARYKGIQNSYPGIVSIHNMESSEEVEFFKGEGPLIDFCKTNNGDPWEMTSALSSTNVICESIDRFARLLLVHNTFIQEEDIKKLNDQFYDLWWCVCYRSNKLLHNTTPPLKLLINSGKKIVLGTDSTASNLDLNLFNEIKAIKKDEDISDTKLISWACINGAELIGKQSTIGSIEIGKKAKIFGVSATSNSSQDIKQESELVKIIEN